MFSTLKFFIAVHRHIAAPIKYLLKKSHYFFRNQSGFSLLEMTVVLVIIGLFSREIISRSTNAIADSRLTAACTHLTEIIPSVQTYLSAPEANPMADDGKTIFTALALPSKPVISTKHDREYIKISGLTAEACIKKMDHRWFIWIGPLLLSDAKKLRDKMKNGEICKENGDLIENMEGATNKKAVEYYFRHSIV